MSELGNEYVRLLKEVQEYRLIPAHKDEEITEIEKALDKLYPELNLVPTEGIEETIPEEPEIKKHIDHLLDVPEMEQITEHDIEIEVEAVEPAKAMYYEGPEEMTVVKTDFTAQLDAYRGMIAEAVGIPEDMIEE